MATKIQINSLECLERLIGGDTETEIEIRNSVAQEFSKKYLKSVITSELTCSLERRVRDEINKTLFTSSDEYGESIKIAPDKARYIRDLVKTTVEREVSDIIHTAIDNSKSMEKLTEIIDSSANYIAEEMTKDNLNERINTLVDKKIKEKLDLK